MQLQKTLFLLALPAVGAAADAQTLVGLEAGGHVAEWAGPPDPVTGYPSGFPGLLLDHTTGACAAPAVAAPPSLIGDVAVDRSTNLTWVTNGEAFSAIDQAGAYVDGFLIPLGSLLSGPITGFGIDSASNRFWITDGGGFASVRPGSACSAVPVVVDAPRPLPIGGVATDIDFDPGSASLFVSDDSGRVTNVDPVGGGVGAHGSFALSPPCSFGVELQGLAVDRSSLGGALYVTDGFTVFYSDFAGFPAPLTFYSPASCYAVPGAPLLGLAQSSHGVRYGTAVNTCDGCPAPTLRVEGQMLAGGAVDIVAQNLESGDDVPLLFYGSTAIAPVSVSLGGTLLLFPKGWGVMPVPGSAPGCGATSVLSTVLPSLPGAELDLQVMVLTNSSTCTKTSNAVHATLAL